jgi:hypothetical protein
MHMLSATVGVLGLGRPAWLQAAAMLPAVRNALQ